MSKDAVRRRSSSLPPATRTEEGHLTIERAPARLSGDLIPLSRASEIKPVSGRGRHSQDHPRYA
jgi:hypothetical protein